MDDDDDVEPAAIADNDDDADEDDNAPAPAASDDDDEMATDGDETNAAACGWYSCEWCGCCCCWANVMLAADVAAVTVTLHISDTMAIVMANISAILDVVRIIRDALKLLFVTLNRLNIVVLNSFPFLNSPAQRERKQKRKGKIRFHEQTTETIFFFEMEYKQIKSNGKNQTPN